MNKTLFKWTIKGNGGERVVKAYDEAEARHLAMVKRWGPPTGIYGQRYMGLGLDVVSQELVE